MLRLQAEAMTLKSATSAAQECACRDKRWMVDIGLCRASYNFYQSNRKCEGVGFSTSSQSDRAHPAFSTKSHSCNAREEYPGGNRDSDSQGRCSTDRRRWSNTKSRARQVHKYTKGYDVMVRPHAGRHHRLEHQTQCVQHCARTTQSVNTVPVPAVLHSCQPHSVQCLRDPNIRPHIPPKTPFRSATWAAVPIVCAAEAAGPLRNQLRSMKYSYRDGGLTSLPSASLPGVGISVHHKKSHSDSS